MSGISGMSGMMGGMRPDPQQIFNRMNKDGSASIDKDELSAMTKKWPKHRAPNSMWTS